MSDIYQSPGDRLRFEILLKSLTEGNLNLAVLSKHDLVLDYYGKLFEERLLSRGEQHVEFCSSTNSEHLVQKFNEILSEVSLDEALEKEAKHAPRRFLIFRDSVLMQDFELQLLARLVNGFPAGNISVILLLNSAGNYHSKLAAFGKNLVEWAVETEAGDAKEPLTDWVRQEPVLEPESGPPADVPTLNEPIIPTAKLLNIPTKTAWRIPSFGKKKVADPEVVPTPLTPSPPTLVTPMAASAAPSVAAPAAAAPVSAPALPVAPAPLVSSADSTREPVLNTAQALAAASGSAPDFKKPEPSKKSSALWVLVLLLLSLGVLGVLYQDLIVEEATQLKKYLLRGTPAAPAPHEAASAALQPASAAEEPALAASAPDVAPEASLSSASAPALAQSAVPQASVASTPVEAASPETAAAKAETQTAASANTKPDAKTDEAWVRQLADNSYVVQLAAMDTMDEMRAFKRSSVAYETARILRARKKDSTKRYFILVAGPFASKDEADRFMQSNPLLAKGWLRSAKSMKTQFAKP